MGSIKPDPTIAIIGGGISGLVLALAFQSKNIPFKLYEAASAFGEIGAGVSFGPNAQRAMELIDPKIKKGFDTRATYNQWESKSASWFDFRVGDGRWKGQGIEKVEGVENKKEGGDTWFHMLDCGVGQSSVHRAHFLDEMVNVLKDSDQVAYFGKRLTNAENLPSGGVRITFQDGSQATHIAVIGCDGIKSRTREVVLGDNHPAAHAIYSGKYAYRGLIPMDKAAELLGNELARNSQMYVGYHGHVLTFAIEKGKTMNVVAFASSKDWESPQWVIPTTKEEMMKDFNGWSNHVIRILENIPKADIWALFNHPPAPTFHKQLICLLGDAAHASTPHQGAGAGMGVEDALIMSEVLSEVEQKGQLGIPQAIEAAFEAYEGIQKGRGLKLVETSREGGMLYDFEEEGIIDDVASIRKRLDERMRWIWEVDLKKQSSDAREAVAAKLKALSLPSTNI